MFTFGVLQKKGTGSALLVSLCIGFGLFPACSRNPRPDNPPRPAQSAAALDNSILAARKAKDEAFQSGSDSPIPAEDRGRFRGLAYYPVNSSLCFRVRLVRYPRPQALRLGTSTGEMRDALRYGYFEFDVQGHACRLQVYRTMEDIEAGGRELFVPFRDGTSGKETYGGGRYIDQKENTSGTYELDFNRAYNPYCAYAKSYSCPVPPPENTLPVPIEAGEKNYRPGR